MSKELNKSLYLRISAGYGDNLMATAVIAALRGQYPELRIFISTKRPDIFENNPHITALYNTRVLLKKNPSIYNLCSVLHYPPYAVTLQSKEKKHYIDYFYDCLPLPVEDRAHRMEIFLSWQERNYRREQLEKIQRPAIAISPYGGATTKIPNKYYPIEKWPYIVKGLTNAGAAVLQFGLKKEGRLLPGAADFRGIGYRNSAAVLLHCDAMITHVSGLMHLATALSVPCVALFGGIEDPVISGYPQNLNLTVPLDCAPCWLPRQCEDPKCKDLLSPEIVVEETIKLIKSNIIKPAPNNPC